MKKFLTIFILALTALPIFAIQEDKKINLEAAIALALKTNPQLELAHLDTDIAKNNISVSNRLQNPSFHTFQNIAKTGDGNPQQFGVDYIIEILKRGKRKETAKTFALSAADNEEFQKHILVAEVKKAYIALLVKKSQLKITKEQENLARELFESIKNQSAKGDTKETEVIQANIALNLAVMYSNLARSEVISAQNHFNSILNTSDTNYDTNEDFLNGNYSNLLAISPEDKIPTLSEIRDFAISNRYDLLMAKKDVEAAQKLLDEVKSQRIPDLSLTGGYAYMTKGMSDTGRFTSGGYLGASIVNIPILYNYRPEIQNAEIEIKKAELKYKDMEIDAVRNLTDAYEKFVITRENLNLYNKKILSDSNDLMVISKKYLDDKKIDLTDFLVSKKLYLELMLGYQDAIGEYCIACAELLKEINADSFSQIEKI